MSEKGPLGESTCKDNKNENVFTEAVEAVAGVEETTNPSYVRCYGLFS